jgi:non-heme chloroperoxidase
MLGYRRTVLTMAIVLILVSICVCAQEPTWIDPSQHRVQFVRVERDVALEVLDWGGSGRAHVLLAGAGNSAHIYDDFTPKLTAICHVYGVTRGNQVQRGRQRTLAQAKPH